MGNPPYPPTLPPGEKSCEACFRLREVANA